MKKLNTEKKIQPKEQAVKNKEKEELSNQMGYLQRTMGNQKIQQLIKIGALPVGMPDTKTEDIKKTGKKRDEVEQDQIKKDRESLKPEIEKLLDGKKSALEKMKKSAPGKPVYARVTVELVYVNLPAGKGETLYHYMKLKKADFSLDNMNKDLTTKKLTRGESMEQVFSYVFDENMEKKAPQVEEDKSGEKEMEADNTDPENTEDKSEVINQVKAKILKK